MNFPGNPRFNLTQQFAILSLSCIALIAVVSAYTLSNLFTEKILLREATISQEFIDSIVTSEHTWEQFMAEGANYDLRALDSFFTHITNMPDMARANVYSQHRVVIWSSNAELIGQRFSDNHELDEALAGQLVFETGTVGDTQKEEHRGLIGNRSGVRFIETYIPIWNAPGDKVVGAVEMYKLPIALHDSILAGQRIIWFSALGAGLLLFAALYWIVDRARRIMEAQHQQLVESRSLSMIGETASAVAHSMRNPLASIRASAELTLTDDLAGARESAEDIIQEADRLDRWARELLQFSASQQQALEPVDLNQLVQTVTDGYRSVIEKAGIELQLDLHTSALMIQANAAPLSQVLGNLIMNAVEALNGQGKVAIRVSRDERAKQARVEVTDNGPGLPEEVKQKLYRPFTTTKPTGTGLGIALSKRLVEHYQGEIDICSPLDGGVSAIIQFPVQG
ncbi:MAG: ATP-binding protein [Motiliproteus sp.]